MRNLLLATAIMVVTTGSLANELPKTIANLGQTEAPTKVSAYQKRSEAKDQLDGRTQGIHRHNGSCRGCSGRNREFNASPYARLTISAYDNLTAYTKELWAGTQGRENKSSGEEAKTQRAETTKAIVFSSPDNAPIVRPEGWTPSYSSGPDESAKCKCGKNCKCPPLVCSVGACTDNYAVVFASTLTPFSSQMWPVIDKLRKDGHTIFYVDTEKYPGVVQQFNLHVWPTTIVMENRQRRARFNGVATGEEIAHHLKQQRTAYEFLTRQKEPETIQ